MQTGPRTASAACRCSGSSASARSSRGGWGTSASFQSGPTTMLHVGRGLLMRSGKKVGKQVVVETVSRLTMYTTVWCGYCVRLKRALEREGIDFVEVDIEQDAEAADFVMSVNGGNATVPTVVLPDGTALTNPPLPDLLSAVRAA